MVGAIPSGSFAVIFALGRCVETAAQNPQGQALAAHCQGQMQMQTKALRGRLVAPDDAQAIATGPGREVQVGPVLDA